jgi:anti-sigma regulatory factor (Ser/Thr protein kinase)
MKLKDIFRPYNRIKELEEEVERLRDENDSAWDMLEEIRTAEKEAVENLAIHSMTPIAEA